MISTWRTVASLIFVLGIAACKQGSNREIYEHTSPGGHTFHILPITDEGVTDITVAAAWSTDWLNDPNNNPWAPSLAIETMLSGGTADRSSADTHIFLWDKNAKANMVAAADFVYIEFEFSNNHRDSVVQVFSELVQRPVWDANWFNRIKGYARSDAAEDVTLGFEMGEAARHAVLGETLQVEFLNGRNLEELDLATLDVMRTWHDETFSHAPVALVVIGAISVRDAGEIIDNLLPPPGDSPSETFDAVSMHLPDEMIYLYRPEAEKSVIGFFGTLPQTRDGKDAIDIVIASLFAAGADSPLFRSIRSDLGASYGMSFDFVNYSRAQRGFVIVGEIETGKMLEARDAVLSAYKTFRAEPNLTSMPYIIQNFAESIRQQMVFVDSSAVMVRELLLDERDPQGYQTLPDEFAQINNEAVKRRLLSAFPDASNLAVFAAGPDPSAFQEACIITMPEQATECR